MAETEERFRYDERDNVQGRLELVSGTPAWEEFYKKHPELKEKDMEAQRLNKISIGNPADNLMGEAIMSFIQDISTENLVDGPVAREKIEMSPERATEKIKGFAAYLGIDIIRIGPLNPLYIYSHKGRTYGRQEPPEIGAPINLTHKHAIVLVNALDTTILRGAPKKQAIFSIHRAYFQLGVIAITLARYIRSLGYPARAQTVQNYQVIVPPIAVDAGVGEFGRNGLVVTKEFGQAIKMSVVTTDLPVVYDLKANLGLDNVCKVCKICAQNCPVGAINPGDKKIIRGAERYPFSPEACFNMWKSTGTDCGVCLISCPFSREPSARQYLGPQLASSGGELPEELMAQIERLRDEGHDPGAQPPYPWMEEQPDAWKKYRFGKVRVRNE